LGAFFGSFLPLSLLPMSASLPQKGGQREGNRLIPFWRIAVHQGSQEWSEPDRLLEKPLVQVIRQGSGPLMRDFVDSGA
jgi:hypothetical protein